MDYIFDILDNNNIGLDKYLPNLNPMSAVCYGRMNNSFVIDVDGTIRKCTEYLEDDKLNNLGNISNGRFNIDQKVHSQWLYPNPKFLSDKGCFHCQDYPICCGGGCPIYWLRENSLSCSIYHAFSDKILKMYFEQKSQMGDVE